MRTHKWQMGLAVASALLWVGRAANAANPQIEVGDGVGAYTVLKCGGVDDGIDVGKKLCYL